MLSAKDIEQVEKRGISRSEIERQIEIFRKGVPYLKLLRPATIGDGIIRLNDEKIAEASAFYLSKIKNNLQPVKFVPASGAASRMFQSLFSFLEAADNDLSAESLLLEDQYKSVKQFFDRLPDFAFYEELNHKIGGIKDKNGRTRYIEILNYLLTDKGLNYGFFPKGLLKFHKYPEGSRTPVEEHMIEGALYGANSKKEVKIHFTVSPEHLYYFNQKTSEAAVVFGRKYGVKYQISFSEQKPSTDTIAVDLDNNPFHSPDGSVLFRPGGHGALLDNLDEIEADIVFIKNIDNVVPDRLKDETVRYKTALAGLLLQYQEKIFSYLRLLEKDPALISTQHFEEMSSFVEKELCIEPEEDLKSSKTSLSLFLTKKLNRPIRICGMVKNLGEPGGGPFWAKNADC